MFNIQQFTYKDILEKNHWQILQEDLQRIIWSSDTKTAFQGAKVLAEKIKGEKEVSSPYLRLVATLKWVAFSLLRESEILNLVEKYFDISLEYEIDPLEKLKLYLTFLPYDQEEETKDNIAKLLERSEIQLTSRNITFGDQPDQSPTIKNWLIDYHLNVLDKPQNQLSLARPEYFSGNKNFLPLDEKSKKKIRILFDYYEFLKTPGIFSSAWTHDVIFEWPDKSLSIIDDSGMYKAYEPPEAAHRPTPKSAGGADEKTNQAADLIQAYQGDPKMYKRILELEKNLESEFLGKSMALRQQLFRSVQKKDVLRTIVVLRLLAKNNDLTTLLEQDVKLKKFLGVVWEQKYGKSVSQEFLSHPSSQKCIQYFLQYVLEERLGLSETEAARHGAQIANIFKKIGKSEYSRLAYFDVGKNEFRWME